MEAQRRFNGGLRFTYVVEDAEFIEAVTGGVRVRAVVRDPPLCGRYSVTEVPLGAGQRADAPGLVPDGTMNGRFVFFRKRPGVRGAGSMGVDHTVNLN